MAFCVTRREERTGGSGARARDEVEEIAATQHTTRSTLEEGEGQGQGRGTERERREESDEESAGAWTLEMAANINADKIDS